MYWRLLSGFVPFANKTETALEDIHTKRCNGYDSVASKFFLMTRLKDQTIPDVIIKEAREIARCFGAEEGKILEIRLVIENGFEWFDQVDRGDWE